MVTRKEIEVKRRQGGYRTLIENGESGFVVDTCRVGFYNESMVFACDCEGKNVDYLDLDCSCGFPDNMMKDEHDKMVNKWVKNMEKMEDRR